MSASDDDDPTPFPACDAVYQAVAATDDDGERGRCDEGIDERFIEGDSMPGGELEEGGGGVEMGLIHGVGQEGARKGGDGRPKKVKRKKKDSVHRSERMRQQVHHRASGIVLPRMSLRGASWLCVPIPSRSCFFQSYNRYAALADSRSSSSFRSKVTMSSHPNHFPNS